MKRKYKGPNSPHRELAMKVLIKPLAAVFAALTMVTHAQASVTICASGYACDDRDRLPPVEVIQPPADLPHVVIEPSPLVLRPFQDFTGWNYAFSAPSQTLSVVLPYFADSGIFAVNSPDGWSYTFGIPDSDGKMTATWQKLSTSSTGFTNFSFKSSLSPSEATYQFAFDDGTARSYQLFIPYSPSAEVAGYTRFSATVPEPSAFAMAVLGLFVCVSVTRRRNTKSILAN
ncbi:MAG: hypothetical protein OJI67_09920 [Prosthecobacter sp.]|nr:hypothetical protein [Prosthecobacter sp.]